MNIRIPELLLILIFLLMFRRSARNIGRTVGRVTAQAPGPASVAQQFRGTLREQPLAPPVNPLERFYAVLELTPAATREQIQQSYRELAKVWHPDRFPNDPVLRERANAKLKEINEAYEALTKARSNE